MSMAAIGVTSLALTGASIGASLAGVGQPSYGAQPNLASSSRAVSDAEAAMLPLQRGMSAAAQTGGDYTFNLPQGADPASMGIATTGSGWYDANGNLVSTDQNYAQRALAALTSQQNGRGGTGMGNQFQVAPQTQQAYQQWQQDQNRGQFGGTINRDRGTATNGAQFDPTAGLTWKAGQSTINGVPVTKNADGSYTISFKGYGAGDVQSQIARQNATEQLALAHKYDPQFIAEALKQEAEADPQSVAARALESDLIQRQIDQPITNPVSEQLSGQIESRLKAGKGLDEFEKGTLDSAVADALKARGGSTVNGDYAAPLTTGLPGAQRQLQAVGLATGELGSGTTPEDVAYRQEQQNLANLSAEISGQTPVSEFGSLSNAQRGPTPQVSGQPLPTMAWNTTGIAGNAALDSFSTQSQLARAQANPWLAGISMAINGINAFGQNMGRVNNPMASNAPAVG